MKTQAAYCMSVNGNHIPHSWQQCHDSKSVIFQEKHLNVLKCYSALWVRRRCNCSLAASFANCVMTLHLLKVHLQTFLSIPLTQKCQILSCDILVANERYMHQHYTTVSLGIKSKTGKGVPWEAKVFHVG